jgi:hypothetical protein
MAKEIYLTQYGLMAERHWREFRPNMVRELEAKGVLMEALFEAQERLGRNSADLPRPRQRSTHEQSRWRLISAERRKFTACQRKSSPPVINAAHRDM